ncbi:MAG: hypothetical protein ACREGI_02195 [Candidatus Levyibacteriota bacterium]
MNLTEDHLKEIKYYLTSFQKYIDDFPLDKVMYKEGSVVAQILYHVFQSANYWLRVVIMEQEYPRERQQEFVKVAPLEEIKASLESALTAVEELATKEIPLDKKLGHAEPPIPKLQLTVDTVALALLHTSAHTAEHFGELHLLVDK